MWVCQVSRKLRPKTLSIHIVNETGWISKKHTTCSKRKRKMGFWFAISSPPDFNQGTNSFLLDGHFGCLWRFPLTTRSQTSVPRSPLPVLVTSGSNLTTRNSNSLMSRDVPYIKVNTTMLFGFTKVTHNFNWPLLPKVKMAPSGPSRKFNSSAWVLRIKLFWGEKAT